MAGRGRAFSGRPPKPHLSALSEPAAHRFEALIFDWDGTAVPNRDADATELRAVIEELCARGLHLALVSGTHVGNIDGQLRARPRGRGSLHLLLNRGSEVFNVGPDGPQLVERREATPQEDIALTTAAELTVARLQQLGLEARIVSKRLNRRKIDLIPEPEWADPPKARIAELLDPVESRLAARGLSGLADVVELARAAAGECGLADACVTSDAKHVEIGLTDKSDSAHWFFRHLERRGIRPGLVLVAGDEMGPLGQARGSDSLLLVPEARRSLAVSVGVEPGGVPPGVLHLGGGPSQFERLLRKQIELRRGCAVPDLDRDPRWVVEVEGVDLEFERAAESLLTMADGRIGSRGSTILPNSHSNPGALMAGVYGGSGPETELLPLPVWQQLDGKLPDGATVRRLLDLQTGVLRQEIDLPGEDRLQAVLFSSLAEPGTAVMRSEAPASRLGTERPLRAPRGATEPRARDGVWTWSDSVADAQVAVAGRQRRRGSRRIDRFAVFRRGSDSKSKRPESEALAALREVEATGFDALLDDHRAAWAGRWETSCVDIPGDPALERAVRVALFHIMASVAGAGDAAVGARGLTGSAYRGHVFWDSDVFVLPVLAATHPAAARAMLEYRIRRLPAALAEARREGMQGAHFPWESAATGEEVAPRVGHDRSGRFVAIRTGQLEEHVVADVAWSACCYADWTGDRAFLAGPGRGLIVETARWWAHRIELDPDGSAHIRGVIGPDEYHEMVDDNTYTNVMARWNLRRAAELTEDTAEASRWLELGDALVDNYDPATGLYEQCAGFFSLEDLVIANIASRRPISATMLLGSDRVSRAQVIKQADVLMLHHLVPDEVVPGSLLPNLDYYEPRTAHASSLSPGIHASLCARAGRFELGRELLGLTGRIDLDDLTGTSAGGLHLAAMGSLWQAIAFGVAGLRPAEDALLIDPRLPPGWHSLEVRITYRGSSMRLQFSPGEVRVWADPAVLVRVQRGRRRKVGPREVKLLTSDHDERRHP